MAGPDDSRDLIPQRSFPRSHVYHSAVHCQRRDTRRAKPLDEAHSGLLIVQEANLDADTDFKGSADAFDEGGED